MCITMSDLVLRRRSGDVLPTSPESLPDPDLRRDPRVLKFIAAARSEETKRKYRWAIDLYLDFCESVGRVEIPAADVTLEAFAAWLADREVRNGKNRGVRGMAPATIRLCLAAVRTFHRVHRENPPDLALANEVVGGHANLRSVPGSTIRDGEGAPALSLPTFTELVLACDPATPAGLRDRAMLCGGMAMMARRHVLSGLDIEHLRRVPEGLEIFIRKDKTHPRGRTAKVPPWPHLPDLDPLRWFGGWVELLASLGVTEGPLFRAVDKGGNVHGAGKWGGRQGLSVRMDPSTVEAVIKRAAMRAALAHVEQMTGHLLRKTGATLAYKFGADILAISRHGGWADNSPVVFRYIKDIDEWERNPMLLIGVPKPTETKA